MKNVKYFILLGLITSMLFISSVQAKISDFSEINRDSQSDAITTLNYDDVEIFLDKEKSVYNVVYVINDDASGELTIDLSKVLDVLCNYVRDRYNMEGYYMEPGDVINYNVTIKTNSGHTYVYKDNSFVLASPAMSDSDELSAVIGFDGQNIKNDYLVLNDTIALGYNYVGPVKVSDKIIENNNLVNEDGNVSDSDVERMIIYKLSGDGSKFGGPVEVLVYRSWIYECSLGSNNCVVRNLNPLSKYLNNSQAVALYKMGSASSDTYSSVLNYLNTFYDGNIENYFVDYYSTLMGTQFNSYSELFVYTDIYADININGSGNLRINTLVPLNAFYDNFYNMLLNFSYGKENIDSIAGNISYVGSSAEQKRVSADYYGYDYSSSDLEDYVYMFDYYGYNGEDIVYNLYKDYNGNVGTIFELFMDYDIDEDGKWYVDDAETNERHYLSPVYDWGSIAATNDSWKNTGNDTAVGDYMNGMLDDSGVWSDTNNFFKDLVGEGISKDGNSSVSFDMAINLDGVLTGDSYQSTKWNWYNSIKLVQIDRRFTLNKVDENHNLIGEAKVKIWYVDNDNNVYYLVNNDDSYSFVKYDSNSDISYVLTTVNGKIDVNYLFLQNITYYLQEVEAPEGYKLNNEVYTVNIGDEDFVMELVNIKLGNLIVNYVDEDYNSLLPSEEYIEMVDTPYETSSKDIDNYDLIRVEGVETGKYIDGTIVVTYVYSYKTGDVIVDYVDVYGNKLDSTETSNGRVNTIYDTFAKDIDGYVLISVPENKTGKYIDGTIHVVYVYEYVMGTGNVEEDTTIEEVVEVIPPRTGRESNNIFNMIIVFVMMLLIKIFR